MCLPRAAALVLAAVLTAAHVPAQGQSGPAADRKPWVLAVGALRDEDAYESLLASVHFGLTEDTWLRAGAGRSRAPSAEADVVADSFELGIEHDFGPAGLSLAFERFGDSGNLETRDWRAGVFVRGERYRVELTHERRAIDVYFSSEGAPRSTDLRRFGLDADSLGIVWRARVGPLWQLYGSWMDYDYPRRVALVPRADRLDLLSTSTVTLAHGFVDEYLSFGIERSFGSTLLNLDLASDRSTLTGERLERLGAAVLWPVAPRMDLELRLGTSRSARLGSALYGGVALLYYGGG